jgi:hypothetical protein
VFSGPDWPARSDDKGTGTRYQGSDMKRFHCDREGSLSRSFWITIRFIIFVLSTFGLCVYKMKKDPLIFHPAFYIYLQPCGESKPVLVFLLL